MNEDELLLNRKEEIIQNQNIQIRNQNEQIKNQLELINQLNEKIINLTVSIDALTDKLNRSLQCKAKKRKSKRNGNTDSNPHPGKIQRNEETINSDHSMQEDEEMVPNSTSDSDSDASIGPQHNLNRIQQQKNANHGAGTVNSAAPIDIANNKWSDIVLADENNDAKTTSPIQIGQYSHAKYAELINGLYNKFNGAGYKWIQLKSTSQPRITSMDVETHMEKRIKKEKHSSFVVSAMVTMKLTFVALVRRWSLLAMKILLLHDLLLDFRREIQI